MGLETGNGAYLHEKEEMWMFGMAWIGRSRRVGEV